MPPTYQEITLEEFTKVVEPFGFKPMAQQGAKEKVFGKVMSVGNTKISLRLYSSIVDGVSRGVGEDAIRLSTVYKKSDDSIRPLYPTDKRVYRTENWQSNLAKLLESWKNKAEFYICPKCNHILVERKNQSNGNAFLGCTEYPKCTHSQPLPNAKKEEAPKKKSDRIEDRGFTDRELREPWNGYTTKERRRHTEEDSLDVKHMMKNRDRIHRMEEGEKEIRDIEGGQE